MLDPLTSLAIACAVAQFLEFGSSLLERAYKISKSPDYALPELRDIEELVGRLRDHAQRLERSRTSGRDPATPAQHADVSEDEALGIALAVECEALAQRIEGTFADIKITGQPTMLESLKLAYAIAKKKKEFAHHKQACEKLKERLMEHMVGAICRSRLISGRPVTQLGHSHVNTLASKLLQMVAIIFSCIMRAPLSAPILTTCSKTVKTPGWPLRWMR